MSSLACQAAFYYMHPLIRNSSNRDNNDHLNKPKLTSMKVNGTSSSTISTTTTKIQAPNHQSFGGGGGLESGVLGAAVTSLAETAYYDTTTKEQQQQQQQQQQPCDRQNIPTKKQLVDPFRQGLMIDGGVGYRQTVVIRSYEVGPDKTVTLESILNLLQETALNHVWMSGLLGDGFGATHGMMKNNLIWVITRMQLQVDYYPIWGEVLEIDTWVGESGKNGMRRDWLIRSHDTGKIFARATSTWVMMNQKTRRLSKMPEEVRAEISPWFVNKHAIRDDACDKIIKLDDNAKYVNSDLKPKRSDLDMNQHVNNVKYLRWMLETIPDLFLEDHQLSSIILEYRRECGSSDVVQALCEPDDQGGLIQNGVHQEHNKIDLLNGFSFLDGHGQFFGALDKWPIRYTHLLQIKKESKNEEIVRGRTTWKRKLPNAISFSP